MPNCSNYELYAVVLYVLLDTGNQEEVDKYSDDLQQLQQMRATATQLDRPSDGAREVLLRYAAQLEALESVFPISETEVGQQNTNGVDFEGIVTLCGHASCLEGWALFNRCGSEGTGGLVVQSRGMSLIFSFFLFFFFHLVYALQILIAMQVQHSYNSSTNGRILLTYVPTLSVTNERTQFLLW